MINDYQLLRYSRHILLDAVDVAGQEAILTSRILVIGCGGLAHSALAYLVASGVGHIVLADDDTVALSNLQRQFWFNESDIGRPKAIVLQQHLQAFNADVQIEAHVVRADEAFLCQHLANANAILDCTDNFATRCLINRVAFTLRKPLIAASALVFDGQLAVYDFRQGHGPCYQCLFGDEFDDTGASCAKNGVFAPLLGIMGAAQANETLKLLVGIGMPSQHYLHCFNALTFQWQKLQLSTNPDCSVCG